MDQLLSELRVAPHSLLPLANKNWVLAFSGGADSVLTLEVLSQYHQSSGVGEQKLMVFYLDHGQEVAEKQRHQLFKTMQSRLAIISGLKVEWYRLERNVSQIAGRLGSSFEFTGGRLRRRHLQRLAGGGVVAFGHTLSDWYETLLMRINRGTSLLPLTPFDLWEGNEIRPLHLVTREEVRNLATKLQLPYWDDPTNTDRSILRNRVREDFSILNENGLRVTAQNLLQEKRRRLQALHGLLERAESHIQKVATREVRVDRAFFATLSPEEQHELVAYQLGQLGLSPLSGTIRQRLQRFPFRHGAYVIEEESWQSHQVIVLRRGRRQLSSRPCNALRGTDITKRHYIQQSYGRKSVRKIFSENRLSERQRYNLCLKGKGLAIEEVDLSIYGGKRFIASAPPVQSD